MLKKITIFTFFALAMLLGPVSSAFAAETDVRTDRATSIDAFDATLEGNVDTNDDRRVYVWFEWDTSSSHFRNTTPVLYVGRTSDEDFSFELTGLYPDTTYYFRAVAENEDGDIIRGDRKSFHTDDARDYYYPYYDQNYYNDYNYYDNYYPSNSYARVSTVAATIPNNSAGTAILNGYVDTQGENVVRWFEWGTVRNYLPESTIHLSHGNASGNFNQLLSGLRSNTTYYFRAVAQGAGNPVYGQVLAFTVRGYIPPPAPAYVPPATPVTVPVIPTITNIPTITIPVKVNPVYEASPAPAETESPTDADDSLLQGRALFGDNFFPNTLIGWMFLLLLVVILVYVAQKAFVSPAGRSHSNHNPGSHGGSTTGHEF